MAGMFYSLEEAAKKLGKTEEEVKLLATEGKLREFRDGSVVMFKIDEVDALVAESGLEAGAEEDLTLDPELSTDTDDLEQFLDLDSPDEAEDAPVESLQVDEEPEPEAELEPIAELEDLDEDLLAPELAPEPEPEPELEPLAELEDLEEDLLAPEPAAELEQEPELEPLADLEALEEEEELLVAEPAPEPEESLELRDDLDALLGLGDDEDLGGGEASEEPVLAAEPQEDQILEDELALAESEIDVEEPAEGLSDTQFVAAEPEAPDGGEASQEDILLGEATGAEPSDLTDMDTALTGEGISVLGESDADFKLTDDTLAETLAGLGATGDTSLEEIEDDINLDSFGSGSGLLDLSLQADDTSLGGILDEIYTTEEDGGDADGNLGTAEEVTAEADSLISESKLEASVEEDYTPAMVMSPRALAEAPPDSSSNLLGGLLFLPLILLIYTTLVTLAGLSGFSPPLVGSISGFIWYIMGGLAVVGLILGIVGIAGGGGGGPKPKKAKKAKKKKEPKKKKEKKPKAKKEKKKKK